MNISQNFVVEITYVAGENRPEQIAPNLAKAVTSWEREFNDEEEDENEGFLVPEDGLDEGEDGDEEEGAEGEEADEEEGLLSDSTLYLTATLSKDVLAEIKALQGMDSDELIKISIIYGNDQIGTIRRVFEVDPDLILNFGSGSKEATDLVVGLTFDIYNSEIVF